MDTCDSQAVHLRENPESCLCADGATVVADVGIANVLGRGSPVHVSIVFLVEETNVRIQ